MRALNVHQKSAAAILDEIWDSVPPAASSLFDSARACAGLPAQARRYLEHAIAPGTPLASAVRLRMHGEIRLRSWYPFTAEQVICRDGDMLWRATVHLHGLPVTGFDRVLGGAGAMQWKFLGLIPFITAGGPDITRSAAGRIAGEAAVWLPSLLCHRETVSWREAEGDALKTVARVSLLGETTELRFRLRNTGQAEAMQFQRWGNPEGATFGYHSFGASIQEEATFDGYTIPTRLRVGWYFGTEQFESGGEFFRVTIDDAQFR